MTKKANQKLHLGCGTIAPEDWINIDSSWNAYLAKYPLLKKIIKMTGLIKSDLLDIPWPKNIHLHDLSKTLPFEDNSIDCIYASHILEHLYLEQAEKLLAECLRVLRPGGIFRVVVPNLSSFIDKYRSKSKISQMIPGRTKADILLEDLRLRSASPNNGNLFFRFYNKFNDTSSHKWMYDVDSLTFYLNRYGFQKIKVKKLYDSKISDIKRIENPDRLQDAVCLEAEK